MKIEPYFQKLNESNVFKKFKEKNPKAYLSAGFFVIDFEDNKNIHQIDYFNPENSKMTTFILDGNEVEEKDSESANTLVPSEIKQKINIDLDILKGMVEDEMKNRTITNKIQKIIAVVQNIDGKLIWNLNCITTDMGIMKVHIEDDSHSIIKFDKVNLFEAVRKL